MSLHLITGYAGQEHITAADNASFNIAMFGDGEFVLDRGNKFKAEIISNNLIRILDGDLMIQGRHVRLKENTYEELVLENGSQGMFRNDLIVARYTKDATTGIEKCEFVVLKGEENAIEGSDPSYITGDITEQGNALITEYPLYRIKYEGLNIAEVIKLFTVGKTIQGKIDETIAPVRNAVGYTVKNILKLSGSVGSSVTGKGLTIAKTGANIYTLNGTMTENQWFELGFAFQEKTSEQESYFMSLDSSKNYMLSVEHEGTCTHTDIESPLILTAQCDDNESNYQIDVINNNCVAIKNENGIFRVFIKALSGVTFSNFVLKLQLEEGEDVTDFEPYVADVQTQIDNIKSKQLVIKSTTFSGTTDANGNLVITNLMADKHIINVQSISDKDHAHCYVIGRANYYWNVRVLGNSSSYQPVTNKSMTIQIEYLTYE